MPFILAVVLTIAITTGVVVSQRDSSPSTTTSTESTASIANVTASVNTSAENPAETEKPNPLSLPALFEYVPTGTKLTFGAVLDNNTVYTRYAISYLSDGIKISGIMNIPKGTGPWPVLFLNHGYIDTSVYTNGRGLKREQDYFARNGFAVLHSDYRCHAQSDCPKANTIEQRFGYVKDVINAVEAVKTSGDSRLSTTKFGMLGHSMGGGITQRLVVSKPDLIQAAVLYAPVSTDERDSFTRYTSRRPTEAQEVVRAYGTLESNPEFWDNLSAKTFLDRITTPLLYFQGTDDADVPKGWTDTSVELLKKADKEVEYIIYSGQPHEFTSKWSDFMRRSADFFRGKLIK